MPGINEKERGRKRKRDVSSDEDMEEDSKTENNKSRRSLTPA
jgi:hypothetical protein